MVVHKFENRGRPTVRRRRHGRQSSMRKKIYFLLFAAVAAFMIGFKLMAGYFGSFFRTETHHNNIVVREDPLENTPYDSPLLIFTCHRPNYLSQTLDDIYRHVPRPCSFGCPIIVSEDGEHPDVEKVILEYKRKLNDIGVPLIHIRHQQALRRSGGAYEALAKHYGWALSQVFDGNVDLKLPIPKRVIILEEDLHIAPDFFSYFSSMATILDEDPSLMAVSAFNDNGHLVNDPKRALRSDFFPGLGWMMTRSLWKDELEAKWPNGYWDDWLRDPAQRQGRQFIRPEISRTYHFGSQGGASNNQFGSILERVKLCDEFVDWSKEDLSFLKESNYEPIYTALLEHTDVASSIKEARHMLKRNRNVALEYKDFVEFQMLARKLDIMDDEKAMIPRTAYNGIVEFRPFETTLLFLKPVR